MSKVTSIFSILFLAVFFQNCGKFKAVGDHSSYQLESNGEVDIKKIDVLPLETVLTQERIDLVDYMISANIEGGRSNLVHSRLEHENGVRLIFSNTKFNDSSNVEIFQADENFIFIRYESTPESYGGIKNVVRRFESINPNSLSSYNQIQSFILNLVLAPYGLDVIWIQAS